jgi:hypothetical protein
VTGNGARGTNAVIIDWSTTGIAPNVRVGRWILDVSPQSTIIDAAGNTITANGAIPGYFYRVVNYSDIPGTQTTLLELETNLKIDSKVVVLMDDVEDVYDKVLGWQP